MPLFNQVTIQASNLTAGPPLLATCDMQFMTACHCSIPSPLILKIISPNSDFQVAFQILIFK